MNLPASPKSAVAPGALLLAPRRRLPLGDRLDVGWLVVAASLELLALCGYLIVVEPLAGVGLSLLLLGAVVFAIWPVTAVFRLSITALLIAYAFFDRGIAHFGVGSLYIGEVVLFVAVLQIAVSLPTYRAGLSHWVLIGFMALGLLRTVPFLPVYGFDALRDSVLWAYAIFALAIASLITKPVVATAVSLYGRIAPYFVIWGLPAALVSGTFLTALRAPGSDIPLIFLKYNDFGVHLTGFAAFVILGLGGRLRGRFWVLVSAMWFLGALYMSSQSRGAFLAMTCAFAVLFLMRPSRHWVHVGLTIVGVLVLALVLNVHYHTGKRDISVRQLTSNVVSIVLPSNGPDTGLEGTREFRVEWWKKIYGYTVKGPYFWTGKGFGINLADDDGFQVERDHSLRAPHNSHMTVLARMGVPGLTVWIVFHMLLVAGVLLKSKAFRIAGEDMLAKVCQWSLVYWLAMMINTSFDPNLEGPQGGIWFWCIVGLMLGLIAMPLPKREADGRRSFTAAS